MKLNSCLFPSVRTAHRLTTLGLARLQSAFGIRRPAILAAGILTLLAAGPAGAGNTWDGGAFGGDNWTYPLNWDGDAVPNYGNPIVFAGDLRNTPFNDRSVSITNVAGIIFTNDGSAGKMNAFTLTGAPIALTGNITTTANVAGSTSTITDIINLDMILTGNRAITTVQLSDTVRHDLTINGIISETGGARTLTKAGTRGQLTLTGANSFSGQVLINFLGTINVTGIANGGLDSPLGRNPIIRIGNAASTSTLNFIAGATSHDRQIQIGDNVATVTATGGAKINNNTPNGAGALVFTNANFNSLNNLVVTNRTLTLGGTNTDANEIQGIIADNSASGGTIGVTKADAGRWILSGPNTYTGVTTVSAGTLTLGNASDTLDGNLTVSGGTLNVDNPDTVGAVTLISGTISGDSTLTGTSYAVASGTVSTALGGSAGLTKTGTGTVTLSGVNSYTGTTTVSNGTLLVHGSLAAGSAVSVSTNATLGGTGTIGGNVTFDLGAMAIFTNGSPLTLLGSLTANDNVVKLNLPANVGPVTNLLATYNPTGSSGSFAGTPVVLSGSFASGTTNYITTGGGQVNLVVQNLAPSTPPATNITYTVSSGQLVLEWPNGLGWQLEAQTNNLSTGITTNWSIITGATSPFTNSLNPANPTVFYRLVYP